jgi:hypothetical protein
MMRRAAAVSMIALACAAACNALSGVGDLDTVCATCGDGSPSPRADAGGPGDDGSADDDGGDPFVPGCTTGACSIPAPPGWIVVLFGPPTSPCPAGSLDVPLFEDATVPPNACTCGACDVTTPPSCSQGTIATNLDNFAAPSCDLTGGSLPANDGGCVVQNFNLGMHIKVTAPPPTGGACNAPSTVPASAVTSTHSHACAAPSCEACAAPGVVACAITNGDQACPPDLPTKHLVGQRAEAHCTGDCATCTVTGGTCTGALRIFDQPKCGIPTNMYTSGACQPTNATTAAAYIWTALPAFAARCEAGAPPSNATASLLGTRTVCCK